MPTRGKNLDLVITSDVGLIDSVTVEEPFESSDHQMIKFTLNSVKLSKQKAIPVYNYFINDYSEICEAANYLRWDETVCDEIKGLDEKWITLKSDLLSLRNKYINVKKRQKNKCMWATKKVSRVRNAKKRAWIKYKNSNQDQKLHNKYKCKLRLSVKTNREAKHNFEHRLAENIKKNPKSF